MKEDINEKEVSFSDTLKVGLLFILMLVVSFYLGYFAGKYSKKSLKTEKRVEKKEKDNFKVFSKKKGSTEKNDKDKKVVKSEDKFKEEKLSSRVNLKLKKAESSIERKESYPAGWYVQVMATKNKSEALKTVSKFRSYPVKLFKPKDNDPWYRVRVGPYKTKNSAKIILIKIKKEKKIRGFIVKVNEEN